MNKLHLLLFIVVLSCSGEEEAGSPPVTTETPTTEVPPPAITQYNLTVTAGEGGTVTEGGTYDEGTQLTIVATPLEGYEFVGWEGSDESTNSLSLTLNADTEISAIFQQIPIVSNDTYYAAGALIEDATISAVFDRSLTVNGIKIVVAGAVEGQSAVPDEWAKKIARMFQLITDPDSEGIDNEAQIRMIKTLRGDTGTWHAGYPTIQRIGYGGGDDYNVNWLRDEGILYYEGLSNFLDTHVHNDMVWYRNSSGDTFDDGDADFQEVMEHVMHTIHLYGVPGGVTNSEVNLFKDGFENPNWNTTPLFMAMKEAIDNGMFVPDYNPNFDSPEDFYQNEDLAYLAFKEYMYLLNFNMWEMSEFWEGESLAPEWNDSMRTPEGILANNPLGHEIYETYMKPVLSKPDFETIRSIFQDNDSGESGYVPD